MSRYSAGMTVNRSSIERDADLGQHLLAFGGGFG